MLVISLMNVLAISPADTVKITTINGEEIISDNISSIDLAFDSNFERIVSTVKYADVKDVYMETNTRGNIAVTINTNLTEYDMAVLRGEIS